MATYQFILTLIRHGETNWNKTHTMQGHTDIELNESGIAEAELLGEYLNKEFILYNFPKPSFILTSPLKRAKMTGDTVINKANWYNSEEKNELYSTSDLLKERCLGKWEGENFKDLIKSDEFKPEIDFLSLSEPRSTQFFDKLAIFQRNNEELSKLRLIESSFEIYQRAAKSLDLVAEKMYKVIQEKLESVDNNNEDDNRIKDLHCVLFSHGQFTKVLLSYIMDMIYKQDQIEENKDKTLEEMEFKYFCLDLRNTSVSQMTLELEVTNDDGNDDNISLKLKNPRILRLNDRSHLATGELKPMNTGLY
eukprot:TRINITY_DN4510_c1_g1_i1.p1 TRINITY_DN4510_c1_g1~~TRINITY_DN4510_c1_g1_i1.p1  ORF type:complete len:307 (+),score=85.69 TRINITY_DN4510_c1_g1_i1:122-1042(+)